MTLNDLASISTIVQTVLVVVSLVFIWYQLRDSTRLAKAANAQSLAEQAASFNALLYQDRELAELWIGGGWKLESMDEISKFRYREMLTQWLIFHENIFYQRKKRLLDLETYNAWNEDLKLTIKHHNLDVVSSNVENVFPGDFGNYLIQLKNQWHKVTQE